MYHGTFNVPWFNGSFTHGNSLVFIGRALSETHIAHMYPGSAQNMNVTVCIGASEY